MPQIICKNLAVGYSGAEILKDVNFTVEKGDFLCIVGENGSGKTTLMRTLLGLNPAMSGTVTYGDGLKPSGIGYLPQHTDVQRDFPATVREIVLSGTQNRHRFTPFYTRSDKQTAHDNMHKMGICSIADKSYRELSGGQQRRVLLARALCATDDILLLDEPVNSLDSGAAEELYLVIKELNKNGITVIMITHEAVPDFATAVLYVDKTVRLERGEKNA